MACPDLGPVLQEFVVDSPFTKTAQDDLPHYPDVVYGWKILRVEEDGTLVSPHFETFWPSGRYLEASEVPDKEQGGFNVPGIHAVMDEKMELLRDYLSPKSALVKIAMVGKIVEHDQGYRCQFAYPSEIYLTSLDYANKIRAKYPGVEVSLMEESQGESLGLPSVIYDIDGNELYRSTPMTIRRLVEEAVKQEASLRGANLEGAELFGANLKGANLKGANLKGASLRWANLYRATLEGANLRGANLRETSLRGADLYFVDFRGADLREADLEGANLEEAYLEGAVGIRQSRFEKMANIFDPIQDELDQRLFKGSTPRERVLFFIRATFNLILDREMEVDPDQYFDLYWTGSTTTYQYGDTSDVDITVFPWYEGFRELGWDPNELRKRLISIIVDLLDGTYIPGTEHPLQYFVQTEGIQPDAIYKPGLRSGWSFQDDMWIVPPEKDRVLDIQRELPELYHRASAMADKMRVLLDSDHSGAVEFFDQIHRKRSEDQRNGLGDASEGNIIYKFLAHEGLFDRLRIGVKIAGEEIMVSTVPCVTNLGEPIREYIVRPLDSPIPGHIPMNEPVLAAEGDEPPTTMDIPYGWKSLFVVRVFGKLQLMSPSQGTLWPFFEGLVAPRVSPIGGYGHEGIHAVRPEYIERLAGYASEAFVVVKVALLDHVVDHSEGYLAKKAYPVEIHVPPDIIWFNKYTSEEVAQELRRNYGVEDVFLKNPKFSVEGMPSNMVSNKTNIDEDAEIIFKFVDGWKVVSGHPPGDPVWVKVPYGTVQSYHLISSENELRAKMIFEDSFAERLSEITVYEDHEGATEHLAEFFEHEKSMGRNINWSQSAEQGYGDYPYADEDDIQWDAVETKEPDTIEELISLRNSIEDYSSEYTEYSYDDYRMEIIESDEVDEFGLHLWEKQQVSYPPTLIRLYKATWVNMVNEVLEGIEDFFADDMLDDAAGALYFVPQFFHYGEGNFDTDIEMKDLLATIVQLRQSDMSNQDQLFETERPLIIRQNDLRDWFLAYLEYLFERGYRKDEKWIQWEGLESIPAFPYPPPEISNDPYGQETSWGWGSLGRTADYDEIQNALDQTKREMVPRGLNEPDWAPLRAVLPPEHWDGWMWMGYGPEGLRLYKHGLTRKYLNLMSVDDVSQTSWSAFFPKSPSRTVEYALPDQRVIAFAYTGKGYAYAPHTSYVPTPLKDAIDKAYEGIEEFFGVNPVDPRATTYDEEYKMLRNKKLEDSGWNVIGSERGDEYGWEEEEALLGAWEEAQEELEAHTKEAQGQVEYVWPDWEDVLEHAEEVVDNYQGVRDQGLIDAAIGATRNQQYYGGITDLFYLAAHLINNIQRQQALVEGNKRTATAVGISFLEVNGIPDPDTDELLDEGLADLIVALAEGAIQPEQLGDWMRSAIQKTSRVADAPLGPQEGSGDDETDDEGKDALRIIYDIDNDAIIIGTQSATNDNGKAIGEYQEGKLTLYDTDAPFALDYFELLWEHSWPDLPVREITYRAEQKNDSQETVQNR